MPSILSLLTSLGSAGALRNARTELELSHSQQVQAAVVARRVRTIDAVAARSRIAVPSGPIAVSSAA